MSTQYNATSNPLADLRARRALKAALAAAASKSLPAHAVSTWARRESKLVAR